MSARQFTAVVVFFAGVYFFASASSEAETPSMAPDTASQAKLIQLAAAVETTAPVILTQTSTSEPPPNRTKLAKEQAAEAAFAPSAIADLIVQTSRQQYYATGHPCACPDDLTRTGRRCGGTSAYSRPGGAAPFCYVSDVPVAMIERCIVQISWSTTSDLKKGRMLAVPPAFESWFSSVRRHSSPPTGG
jgi:hypothetical protein